MKGDKNPIYGNLNTEEVNQLTEDQRKRMFIEWVTRKPTVTGWFITYTLVTALGEEFVKYVTKGIVQTMVEDEEKISEETVEQEVWDMFEYWATYPDELYDYIETYKEECPAAWKDVDIPEDWKKKIS